MGRPKDPEKRKEWLDKISRNGKGKEIVFHEDENGCHVCTSHNPNHQGYPIITYLGRHLTVAHLMYERKIGKELPKGTLLRHTCDNRQCINPDHLIPGTPKENSRDMVDRGRVSRQVGELNPNAKLTEKQVLEIIDDLKTMNCSEVGRKRGVPIRTVNDIKNGKRWGWLTNQKAGEMITLPFVYIVRGGNGKIIRTEISPIKLDPCPDGYELHPAHTAFKEVLKL